MTALFLALLRYQQLSHAARGVDSFPRDERYQQPSCATCIIDSHSTPRPGA
jgi:hypothetical protein